MEFSEINRKSRMWTMTTNNYQVNINNYPVEWVAMEFMVNSGVLRWAISGREIAPKTGTPHLQSCVYFNNAVRRSTVVNYFVDASVEISVGSVEQNWVYCTKDKDYIEFGNRPKSQADKGKAGAEVYRRMIQLASDGNENELKETMTKLYVVHYNTIKKIQMDCRTNAVDLDNCCGVWIHGLSGAGKSYFARTLCKGKKFYYKMVNKWWCGFQGEDYVIIEDVSPRQEYLADFLKIWLDRYSFTAEVKGGITGRIRPKWIIITSNFTIEQCFPGESFLDARSAIERRCNGRYIQDFSRGRIEGYMELLESLIPNNDKDELVDLTLSL